MNQTRTLVSTIAALAFSALPLLSQQKTTQKPAFEVVSIKLHNPATPSSGGGPRNDRLTMSGVTFKDVLQQAYQHLMPGTAADFQVIGGPYWIDDDRYDVDAKADCSAGPISREQYQLMVQSLLEERFALKAHIEPREVPSYDLVIAKGGPKLKASLDQSPVSSPNTPVLCRPQTICCVRPEHDPI